MALVPFDDRDGVIWMDGAMVPWRDARLHVLTHGLHYASGVFEGERAYSGHIFKLREHTERLINSAAILGFEIPYAADQIDAACQAVLAANGLTEGYVRPIAWRGSEQLSVSAQATRSERSCPSSRTRRVSPSVTLMSWTCSSLVPITVLLRGLDRCRAGLSVSAKITRFRVMGPLEVQTVLVKLPEVVPKSVPNLL